MKVMVAILFLASLMGDITSVFPHSCSGKTSQALRNIATEDSIAWANLEYRAKLDDEYITKLQAKFDWGSKDLPKFFQLSRLQNRFHLLQTAFEKTSLNNIDIANLFEIHLEHVIFWRDRPYRFENGKIIL